MAKATMSSAAILLQASVVLAFFLAVCMARNNVELERAVADLPQPGITPNSPSSQPSNPNSGTSCTETYKVKKGQTCYFTWTKYHLKPETFYALNPDIDCDNLDIGQELCIAGEMGTKTNSSDPTISFEKSSIVRLRTPDILNRVMNNEKRTRVNM